MSAAPFIELTNLTHVYNEKTAFEKKAVDDVSTSINYGECVGIIGHTGSGKSTLIQHFNGLLKPSSGLVKIDGEDVNADKKSLKRIRERIGLVFQYPEAQLFDETLYKDIAFGPRNMGLSEEEIKERVYEALNCVGLPESLLKDSPFELSGGQKRRAAIAGVLAMRPDALIMDEPTAGLDPSGREEILSYIKSLADDAKRSVIIVSHSMEDIAKLCGRIFVMANGKIVIDGTPAEVFNRQEQLESIGLAAPQIAVLTRRLREAGLPLPEGIFTSGAAAEAIRELAARVKNL